MVRSARAKISFTLLVIFLASCSQIRQVTYPKGFVYIDRVSVKSTMHKFSSSLHQIELVLGSDSNDESAVEKINLELANMEKTANDLYLNRQSLSPSKTVESKNNYETNHLVLDENLDEFLSKILLAKLQVQADPPNFYQVGKLAGECTACHILR